MVVTEGKKQTIERHAANSIGCSRSVTFVLPTPSTFSLRPSSRGSGSGYTQWNSWPYFDARTTPFSAKF